MDRALFEAKPKRRRWVIGGVRPSMKTNWVAFAIFLDGVKKFEACDASVIPTLDLLERMQFVHDNIEYCFAEGRMMDSANFFVLDNAADRIALDEYSHLYRYPNSHGENQQRLQTLIEYREHLSVSQSVANIRLTSSVSAFCACALALTTVGMINRRSKLRPS